MSLPATPLQQVSITEPINQAIANAIEYLPTLLAALAILVIGYIIGRVLGGIVTRIILGLGIGQHAEGDRVDGMGDGDGLARGLGAVVSFYVYFVALVAAANVLDIPQLTDLLAGLGSYLPVILGALIVLVVGFLVGRIVGDAVAGIVSGFGAGSYLRGTPLGQFGQDANFGRLVGTLVTYYIYLVTLLAVADILDIDALSTLLNDFAAYLPLLVAGLLVLLVGVWLAERSAEAVRASGDGRAVSLGAVAVKLFIYYITITIALATVGLNIAVLTTLLMTFAVAFFGALALALALGIGLAVGLGGQDYVDENIGSWVSSARGSMSDGDDGDQMRDTTTDDPVRDTTTDDEWMDDNDSTTDVDDDRSMDN